MSDHLTKYLDPISRTFLALIFILSGIGKISAFAGTQSYMEAFGLPGILLTPTIIFEIGGGLFVLVGFKTRLVAALLAGFCLVSAFIFHMDFADQTQQIMFLKNIAMAGGFFALVRHGSDYWSVDAYRAQK